MTQLVPQNPGYVERVRALFEAAPFVQHLGIVIDEVGPGLCITQLTLRAEHLQQNGYVHAGVQATLADHTAGGAAGSLLREDQGVLSVEFKINLLRPGAGQRLTCRATVLKAGRTLSIVESEVFAHDAGRAALVAKATVTLMIVAAPDR